MKSTTFRTLILLSLPFFLGACRLSAPVGTCSGKSALNLFVDAKNGNDQGTAARKDPVRTIPQALAIASKSDSCGTVIDLAPGTYPEPVSVSGNLAIRGQDPATTMITGPVVSKGTHLRLQGITFDAIQGVAVQQSGGALATFNVVFRGTQIVKGNLLSGASLILDNSAQALISLTIFESNQAIAIRAYGTDTRLWLETVVINNTGFNMEAVTPEGTPDSRYVGAVQVLEHAEVYGHLLIMTNNAFNGLNLSGHAKANITDLRVTGTQSISIGEDQFGGIGVSIRDGAKAELTRLNSLNSEFVGVSLRGGYLQTHGGTISSSPIGFAIHGPFAEEYTPGECLNTIRVVDVDVPLDAEFLPLPCAFGESCPRACPEVPYIPAPRGL